MYKLKKDRVTFENMSIVWDRKKSTRAINNFEIKSERMDNYTSPALRSQSSITNQVRFPSLI
jgi:hypothetical protein